MYINLYFFLYIFLYLHKCNVQKNAEIHKAKNTKVIVIYKIWIQELRATFARKSQRMKI